MIVKTTHQIVRGDRKVSFQELDHHMPQEWMDMNEDSYLRGLYSEYANDLLSDARPFLQYRNGKVCGLDIRYPSNRFAVYYRCI